MRHYLYLVLSINIGPISSLMSPKLNNTVHTRTHPSPLGC